MRFDPMSLVFEASAKGMLASIKPKKVKKKAKAEDPEPKEGAK